MTVKLSRGQKLCKSCGTVNAARQRVCKGCHYEFISSSTPISGEITDWKNLEKGKLIKIIQGTGPYYKVVRDTDEHAQGDRIPMGNIGVFKVIRLDSYGIIVCGATNKNSGYSYLYMGESKVSPITGLNLEPYRIKSVKLPKKKKKRK